MSSNPRQVSIKSPISMNAPDLIFSRGKLELEGELLPVGVLPDWHVGSYGVSMNSCVLQMPQQKVHMAEIWEKA